MAEPNIPQRQAMKALDEKFRKSSLVVLPSGSGKTYLAAFHSKKLEAKKILYLAHRQEILDQAREIFRDVHGNNISIGMIDQNKKDFEKDILFGSIQTVCRKKSLERLEDVLFDYIIIDEFHHASAESYKRIMEHLKTKFLLGITATPYRSDGSDVTTIVDDIAFSMSLKQGIERNILVPFNYFGLHDDVDYTKIVSKNKKYKETDLDRILVIRKRDKAIIKEYKKHCLGRLTLGFCVNVRHVHRITEIFNESGIKAVGLTHKDEPDHRRAVIEDFKAGRYQVLFTRDIFNEGVDIPQVEALLFLRPTISKLVFFQQLGRGLRKATGKKNVIVLDFIGNYARAFMKREWLSIAGEEGQHYDEKSLYNYNLPSVTFDKKLIDLFEIQKRSEITKKNLIDNYFETKDKLGHQPSAREIDKSRFWSSNYRDYFVSWNSFLREMGEPVKQEWKISVTREALIDNYFMLKKILGFVKTSHIRKRYGSKYHLRQYNTEFGTWNKFLETINEKPLRRNLKGKKTPINKSKIKKNHV